MQAKVRQVFEQRGWALKCLAINALGSAVDYSVLFSCAHFLNLATPAAALCGVACGATFNFVFNRRYAFAQAQGFVGSQALRFAVVMGCLMLIHAPFVGFLRDGLGLPLVAAKIAGDLGILAFSQPFLLRRFVFRPAEESVQERPLSAETIIRVAGDRLSV